MIEIQLQAIPSQTLSIRLDDNLWDLKFRVANLCMVADITRNNVILLSSIRMVALFPIIPYQYMESGNFVIATNDDDLPDYNEFGITQTLIYASQEEIEAIRAGT